MTQKIEGLAVLLVAILFAGTWAVIGLARPDILRDFIVRTYDRWPSGKKLNPFWPTIQSPGYARLVRVYALAALTMTIVFIVVLINYLRG